MPASRRVGEDGQMGTEGWGVWCRWGGGGQTVMGERQGDRDR